MANSIFARCQSHDFDAERPHDPLPPKTGMHPLSKIGTLGLEGHGFSVLVAAKAPRHRRASMSKLTRGLASI